MKTIGIKLADGSFYPIMQEGIAEKKQINLTTVKDNQTTVQVDLYRSDTGTMENAEYVDSLEIKNLVKHPNGEPDISLDISLDENNELKAELHDQETGGDSRTTVALVSIPAEQRNVPSEVTQAQTDNIETINTTTQNENNDFSIDDFDLPEVTDEPLTNDTTIDDTSLENSKIDNEPKEKPLTDNIETIDTTTQNENDEAAFDDFDLPEVTDKPFEQNEVNAVAFDDFDLPEVTDKSPTDNIETINTTTQNENDEAAFDDFDLPEVTDKPFEQNDANAVAFDDFDLPEVTDEPPTDNIETINTTTQNENDEAAFDDFDLPEVTDELTTNDATIDDTSLENSQIDNEPSNQTSDDFSYSENANAGLDFSDILDEETKEGRASSFSDNEQVQRKTKIPMLICIICAIICVLAVVLILFVFPSKANIINKQKEEPKTQNQTLEQPAKKEEPTYDAKENEIVVVPAEEVVPKLPEKQPPENKNITYKIKWGDTLWDISKSYYNNPWKYPKIAKYNGIKNPDHIISGTTIIIPVE